MSSNHIAEMGHAVARSAQYQLHHADMKLAATALDHAWSSSAAIGAERSVLRAALAKFDPNHPLLVDDALTQKIRDAGESKFWKYPHDQRDWDSILHAADNIPYAYRQPAQGATLGELESANIQNHVEKHALREALRRVDKSHPLIRPDADQNMLVAALRKAGLMAHSFGGYDAVAEAGRTFKYPENMLWGQRESVLEEYPGEIEALEKRIAYLRNPNIQRLKMQQMNSPS